MSKSSLTPTQKKAQRYGVPEPNQYIRLPSVEVLCEWMKLRNMQVVGWKGDLLVVRPMADKEREKEDE